MTAGCLVEGALVVFGMLSVFCFSGILLGWAPFMHALLSEGQFSELCHGHTNETARGKKLGLCDEQVNMLNLIFTLGSAMISACSLPCGVFLDAFGPRAAVFVSLLFELSGLVLLAFANSKSFDVFIPGVLSIAIGGLMTMLAAFPISFRFPKYQAAILATISCLFDASSLIFALFNYAKEFYSRQQLMLGFAVFCAIVYTTVIACWSATMPPIEDLSDGLHGSAEDGDVVDDRWSGSVQEQRQLLVVGGGDDATSVGGDNRRASIGGRSFESSAGDGDADSGGPTAPPVLADDAPLAHWTIYEQLWSFEFRFLVAFGSVQMLRANAYIGFNDALLAHDGDDVVCHGWYTSVFGWVLPASIVFIPLIDWSIRWFGVGGTLHITNVWGMIYGGLVLVDSLEVQLATFAVFVGFRAFLYATMSTFTAQNFGLATLGTVTGTFFTTSAVVALLQYPLQWMTTTQFGDDPRVSSIILVSLCIPLGLLVAWFQARTSRQRSRRTARAVGDRPDSGQAETEPLLPKEAGVR
mmetsp:Transcript_7524/g.19396  ORF Transcript_7524/g.19396 Transcript_7524/m.19396 type:complete len:525 (+) Transcript_7524:421-1995(+)|eukprot:CAMPEP_0182918776 /NCGR_PEP_ID=MMETSP0105_2-20130417/2296_1 /TAXON_ID=81532 ORGANISM="Acanthoeca-like sp., Strain 10tr" /NCGR_SAMPLE_ID=MMETSP0105_2 /ASSEMBLY_ACC=CAM_ASM_000205 /LENGTH=524 /DNA_ID=CAMNT_0025055895 /DNA_START=415 /DNA_END=1989 /DNA_ORIENTATION=+